MQRNSTLRKVGARSVGHSTLSITSDCLYWFEFCFRRGGLILDR